MLQFLNKSLKSSNTFQLDVIADRVIELSDKADLSAAIADLSSSEGKRMILGGGSNVLFSGDYNGTVLLNRLKGIEVTGEDEEHYLITSASGVNWDDFVETSVKNDWYGLENLSLIPGTVGAAPIQNIGAYGQEAGNLIESVTSYDILNRTTFTLTGAQCRFGYRTSIFKNELKGRVFIINVTFRLRKHFTPILGYRDVAIRFEERESDGILAAEVREAVIEIRKAKLPNPAEIGNAGSFFKNPEISTAKFTALKQKHPGIPAYPIGNVVKIPAGWLIQEAGWKGRRYKNCGTYPKQALVLVNYGDAHPSELLELKEMIKTDVMEKFSIKIEEEVNIID